MLHVNDLKRIWLSQSDHLPREWDHLPLKVRHDGHMRVCWRYSKWEMVTMLLTTHHLTKTYRQRVAVNDINLQVTTGSFTAIIGPNGACKSTFIKMLIGQLVPSAGTIELQTTKQVGVVFQNSVLDSELTVVENLQLRAHQYHYLPKHRVEQLGAQLDRKSVV